MVTSYGIGFIAVVFSAAGLIMTGITAIPSFTQVGLGSIGLGLIFALNGVAAAIRERK